MDTSTKGHAHDMNTWALIHPALEAIDSDSDCTSDARDSPTSP